MRVFVAPCPTAGLCPGDGKHNLRDQSAFPRFVSSSLQTGKIFAVACRVPAQNMWSRRMLCCEPSQSDDLRPIAVDCGWLHTHARLEHCCAMYVRRYDNLTVTLQHDTENQGHFCTLLARGSPYMTFEFAEATPRITSNGEILKVYYCTCQ